MTVYDVLKKINRVKNKHKGEFGLEIETESAREYEIPLFAFWDAKGDGSLRNFGIEYVLKQPLFFNKDIKDALEEFKEKTKHINFIKDSITTSVHVHINMLNETLLTLGNFLVAYSLVENLLVRYCGSNRLSNGFSLPICDAEENYLFMKDMLDCIKNKEWQGLIINPEASKYAGLNLSSLARFGSLEIRLFKGTTDIDEIYNWLSILYDLLTYCRKNVNPHEIIKSYKNQEENILKDIFKNNYENIRHVKEKELLETNFLYATNLAYTIKDWSIVNDLLKPVKKPSVKDLDRLAQVLYKNNWDYCTAAQQKRVLDLINKAPNEVKRILEQGVIIENPDIVVENLLDAAAGIRPAQNILNYFDEENARIRQQLEDDF